MMRNETHSLPYAGLKLIMVQFYVTDHRNARFVLSWTGFVMLLRLARSAVRNFVRLLLGPAANAGRQVADPEQRIAMPERLLSGDDGPSETSRESRPSRQVGHLAVFEGGRSERSGGNGPLGRPSPVSRGGRRAARG